MYLLLSLVMFFWGEWVGVLGKAVAGRIIRRICDSFKFASYILMYINLFLHRDVLLSINVIDYLTYTYIFCLCLS